MTRPKRVRQRAKSAHRDCREMPVLRRVWVQLTSKYALELQLLDGGAGSYSIQIFWHPGEPADHEMKDLHGALATEIDRLMLAALDHDDRTAAS